MVVQTMKGGDRVRRFLFFVCCLAVLLCGCAPSDDLSGEVQSEEDTGGSSCDHTARLAYYEERAEELERELLALKTEIYVGRVEYEEKLGRLERELAELREETQGGEVPSGGTITPTPESDFRYTVGNGVATVTEYVGNARAVRIPSVLGGYPVRAIGDRAFADHTSLTSVIIPDSVEQIGWFSFAGCVMLERVAIPSSVTSVSYGAFQNCRQTLAVVCPSGSYAEQYARSYGFTVETA